MDLKRPVPLWLFLTGLLLVGLASGGAFYLPRLLAPEPSFQLSLNPPSVLVRPESVLTSASFNDANSSRSFVTVKSLNGFSGLVTFSATFAPAVAGNLAQTTVLLGSDAAVFGLNATTTMRVAASSLGDYIITVQATSGSLSRTVNLTVHSRDVSMRVSQTSTSLVQGSSMQSLITFSSLNGFAGNLTLDESPHQTYPNGYPYNGRWFVNATISASSSALEAASTSSVTITVAAGDFAPQRNYNFTTVVSYGSWTWQAQISVAVTIAPEPSLPIVSYSFASGTNATLVLRNAGPAAIEITSYNVTDSVGDTVTGCFGFPIPTGCYLASFLVPTNSGAISVLTTLCGFCTLHGNSFTYQVGQTYTVVLTTSRLNLFTYKITR